MMRAFDVFIQKTGRRPDPSAPLLGRQIETVTDIKVGEAAEWPSGTIKMDLWAIPSDGICFLRPR